MQIHNVEQGSDEWHAVRLGIPTASEFAKILTPTGKLSAQAEAYANKLVAEKLAGKRLESFEGNDWTERGNELEAAAVSYYEVLTDSTTEKVGFVTAGECGCSPDRLVGDDGLLEIKCPAPHTHVHYMLTGKIEQKYTPQVQGQLMITGRKWCDLLSYHPDLPPVLIRIERDEDYIEALRGAIKELNKDIAEKFVKLS